MDAPKDTGHDTYRLLITRRAGSEMLVVPDSTDWSLPRTQIPSRQRPAEQLTAAIRNTLALETCCLFLPSPLSSVRSSPPTKYGVMESISQYGSAPGGTFWRSASDFTGCRDAQETKAVRKALSELKSYASGDIPGPFGRPGWLPELFQWAEKQAAPLGLRLSGKFRQLNAGPSFSLIRLETNGVALWFKATGKPHEDEPAITLSVARLFPRYVPRIVGIQSAWNGWLAAEASGVQLDEMAECSAWERAAENLAELQISSIGKCAELLDAKCKDLRLAKLGELITPFLDRMGAFMAAQTKRFPAPLARSELASLREGLAEACALLESLHLPDTLAHVDLNPGNILVSPYRCVFLDWAGGAIGHPFVTFEYLRQYIARSGLREAAAAERITTAYLRPWEAFFSPEVLQRAMAIASLLAVFAYAVASEAWRRPDSRENSASAGYLRSLTRRMFREAVRVAERSAACLD